jgi:hypothetical protein
MQKLLHKPKGCLLRRNKQHLQRRRGKSRALGRIRPRPLHLLDQPRGSVWRK